MLESCDKNLKCLSLNSKTSASNTVCTKNHDTVAFDLKNQFLKITKVTMLMEEKTFWLNFWILQVSGNVTQ